MSPCLIFLTLKGRGHFPKRSFCCSQTDHPVGGKGRSSSNYSSDTGKAVWPLICSVSARVDLRIQVYLLAFLSPRKQVEGRNVYPSSHLICTGYLFLHRTWTWNTFEVLENHLEEPCPFVLPSFLFHSPRFPNTYSSTQNAPGPLWP